MSSEAFENYEYEFEDLTKAINKKIQSQLPNYTGEQWKSCIKAATKDVERSEDLLREMEMESRSAPPSYRTKMQSRLKGYQSDVRKFRDDLQSAQRSGGSSSYATDRDALLKGGSDWESHSYDQRSRLIDNEDTLGRTSERIANSARIGEESEAIGAGVLNELGTQRETIIRTAHKVQSVDANLGKSKRLLNAMSRRVMTNQMTMVAIILVLFAILGIALYLKLGHHI